MGPGVYGLTGGAGAGKTTLANKLKNFSDEITVYSADYKFIGGSETRKQLLRFKQGLSIEAYIDAANQYNWWDWDAIENDLRALQAGQDVAIHGPYNREKGQFQEDIIIKAKPYILYEGNNTGSPSIIDMLNFIFILNTDPEVRFQRLLSKDGGRRTFKEVMARFLITEYSENLSYRLLERWYAEKIRMVDADGNLDPWHNVFFYVQDINFIPLQMGVRH